MVRDDLAAEYSFFRRLTHLVEEAAAPTPSQLDDVTAAGFSMTFHDFETAVERLKGHSATSAGAPKIPKTSWNDVGGLFEAKKEILDTIQLPLTHPEMFAEGVKVRYPFGREKIPGNRTRTFTEPIGCFVVRSSRHRENAHGQGRRNGMQPQLHERQG